MDPISQGALGAALPQATSTSRNGAVALAGLFGFLAGMAADLDVLIRSSEDPLLFLEYHRQFTHSLLFIAVGGLISATVLNVLFGRRTGLPFPRTFLFCTLGYGTHGMLDFATSYGTMLFWPFSDERYAASIISIIDPIFTLPLVVLVVLAGIKRAPIYARLALAWACLYFTLGVVQHVKAIQMTREIAAERGHQIERLTVKPSFGNILVWRSVYQSDGRFFINGLRVGIAPAAYPGVSIPQLDPLRDFPWLKIDSQQFHDLQRFDQFSQGYAALDPSTPNAVIDVRYAFLPNEVGALWSIKLMPDGSREQHVEFQTNRGNARANLAKLWYLIFDQPD